MSDVSVDFGAGVFAVGWTTLAIVLAIYLVGFIVGIVAMVKAANKGGKLMPWWGHLLVTLFATPIEIILGSIEIHKQNM